MNSRQRRKSRRALARFASRLQQLAQTIDITDKWNQVLQGIGPAGRTDK